MQVVQLAEFRDRDTVTLLRGLLHQAESGQLHGVAVCFLDHNGTQDAAFTGSYRRNPSKGVAAAMSLSMRLAQYDDELQHPAR